MQKDLNIKKILIPYDFSETAALSLEHAIFMAKLLKADIYLLHIVETTTFPSSISHAFTGFEKKVEEASNEKLKELADEIHRQHGVQVQIITEVGKIYKRIVHTAKQAHVDIIIMGTHGASGSSYIIGSNTTRVVQEAPCPVISVQTHITKVGFAKIALPIDDSAESRQKVNFALEIAKHYNSRVVVIGLMRNGNEDYQRKFKIKIEQVEDFLSGHGIITESIYKQGDDLAKSTLQSSAEIEADLLVIMTEQEPSITGLLMGSYATKVINGSKIPVMTVRPAEIDPERITVTF
ncbi:MAG: universal stress protein [Bacteroidetes bacterium]|nr:universal stress protein [Bacteroidota bacterium]